VRLSDCVAKYGQNLGYIDPTGMSVPGMTGSMANMGMHVSYLSECSTGQVKLGDNMTVTVHYTEYIPMNNTDGSLGPIMGIALLCLAHNETYISTTSDSASLTRSGSRVSASTSTAAASTLTGGPFLVTGAMGVMVAWGSLDRRSRAS